MNKEVIQAAFPQTDVGKLRNFELLVLDNVRRNLRDRLMLLSYYADDPDRQAEELEECARDPVYWINRWAWTHDPRLVRWKLSGNVPFVLYPKQIELVRWIEEQIESANDGTIEKSRAQGVTWIFSALSVWMLLFVDECSVAIGSRKEDLVDLIGNMDCIFEKCRHIIMNLPQWQRRKLLELEDKHMLLRNKKTRSSIKGEAGDNIGRGGRNTFYWVDEHAFLARADKVEAALVSNAPSVIRISTHAGEGTRFYNLTRTLPTFRLHWSDNPTCDEEWYEVEKAKYGYDPVMIAQELDINPGASVSSLMLPNEWIRQCVGRTHGNPGDVIAGYDIAGAGTNKNAVVIRSGANVIHIETWAGTDDLPASIYRAIRVAEEHGASLFIYDAVGMGETIGGILKRVESLPFVTKPIRASSTPIRRAMTGNRLSTEFFLNIKAQLWWNIRERAMRTFQVATGGADYPPESLLGLPDNPDLITQLITPMMTYTATGKVRVETKDELKRRGVVSPDIADALILSYANDVTSAEPNLAHTEMENKEIREANNYKARESVLARHTTARNFNSEVRDRHSILRNSYGR